jgi:hypothetical protein
MGCLELAFTGLRQVCFFEEEITLSDRKRGNLNFALAGLGDTWPESVEIWLSLDNRASYPHTGDH